MKTTTRSFYETAVGAAVRSIVSDLDRALDLEMLARRAALSPLHFHRIFRGMIGETPLELHRRLRMERAAHRLIHGSASVTAIAFDAGYETHEAFTRAFGKLYGEPPSSFRESAEQRRSVSARPLPSDLAALSGVHFRESPAGEIFALNQGERETMNVEIKTLPALRVAAVHHRGSYSRISEAFARLGDIAGRAGLFSAGPPVMLAIYHDDPDGKPAEELSSEAAIVVGEELALPGELAEIRLSAGRYATTLHLGPYTTLGDTWARFMGGWLPGSGHRLRDGASFEIYRNNPSDTPADKLVTELHLPID